MNYNLKLLSLFILSTSCLIRSSNGFSMSIFGSTDIWPGSSALIQWHDGARNVNAMLAVQNNDTTLSPVGQTTFNVAPYGSTIIRINSGTPTGRNYFFIAEDIIDPSNYTSVGPFSIIEPFGDAHPTNSIIVTATERFSTDEVPTATSQGASASVRSKSTNTANTDSNNDNDDIIESSTHVILSMVQIIGIVVGCVGAVIVGAIIYVCCFKRSKGTPAVPLYPPAPVNMNGPSRVPGVPTPIKNPTVKKQSLKKPIVAKVDSSMTVVASIPSPKLQENTTINFSNDLSYTQHLANQSPSSIISPQQVYPYYGNNEMYYGNQMQYPYQDTMPMPTHFTNPSSPTSPSFAYMQQQQMYTPQNQAVAASYWNYPPPPSPFNFPPKQDANKVDNKTEQIQMASATTTTQKTELAAIPAKTEQAESSLSQKFEMPAVHADLEQKHDNTSLFQKPHAPSSSSFS